MLQGDNTPMELLTNCKKGPWSVLFPCHLFHFTVKPKVPALPCRLSSGRPAARSCLEVMVIAAFSFNSNKPPRAVSLPQQGPLGQPQPAQRAM